MKCLVRETEVGKLTQVQMKWHVGKTAVSELFQNPSGYLVGIILHKNIKYSGISKTKIANLKIAFVNLIRTEDKCHSL